jgi:hypothetical protein
MPYGEYPLSISSSVRRFQDKLVNSRCPFPAAAYHSSIVPSGPKRARMSVSAVRAMDAWEVPSERQLGKRYRALYESNLASERWMELHMLRRCSRFDIVHLHLTFHFRTDSPPVGGRMRHFPTFLNWCDLPQISLYAASELAIGHQAIRSNVGGTCLEIEMKRKLMRAHFLVSTERLSCFHGKILRLRRELAECQDVPTAPEKATGGSSFAILPGRVFSRF